MAVEAEEKVTRERVVAELEEAKGNEKRLVELLEQEGWQDEAIDHYLSYFEARLPRSLIGEERQKQFIRYSADSISILSPDEIEKLADKCTIILPPKQRERIAELKYIIGKLKEFALTKQATKFAATTLHEIISEMVEIKKRINERVDQLFDDYYRVMLSERSVKEYRQIAESLRYNSGWVGREYSNNKEKQDEIGRDISQLASLREEIIFYTQQLKGLLENFSVFVKWVQENKGDAPAHFLLLNESMSSYIEHLQKLCVQFSDADILLKPYRFNFQDNYHERELAQKKYVSMQKMLFFQRLLKYLEKLFLTPASTRMLSTDAVACYASKLHKIVTDEPRLPDAMEAESHALTCSLYLYHNDERGVGVAKTIQIHLLTVDNLSNFQKYTLGKHFLENPTDRKCELFALECLRNAAFNLHRDQFSSSALNLLQEKFLSSVESDEKEEFEGQVIKNAVENYLEKLNKLIRSTQQAGEVSCKISILISTISENLSKKNSLGRRCWSSEAENKQEENLATLRTLKEDVAPYIGRLEAIDLRTQKSDDVEKTLETMLETVERIDEERKALDGNAREADPFLLGSPFSFSFDINRLPKSQGGAELCLAWLENHLLHQTNPVKAIVMGSADSPSYIIQSSCSEKKVFFGLPPLIQSDLSFFDRESDASIDICIRGFLGFLRQVSLNEEDLKDFKKFKALCRAHNSEDVVLGEKNELSVKLAEVYKIALQKEFLQSRQSIEKIVERAKEQGWIAVSDKAYGLLAGFYFSKRQYSEGSPYAEKIETADHLSHEQAFKIGEYYISQGSANATLKGLRFLYRAASSTKECGERAREMLQQRLYPEMKVFTQAASSEPSPLQNDVQDDELGVTFHTGGLDDEVLLGGDDEKKDEALPTSMSSINLFFESTRAQYQAKVAELEARVQWEDIFKKGSGLSELIDEIQTFVDKEIEPILETPEIPETLQGKIWREAAGEEPLSFQWMRIQQRYKDLQVHQGALTGVRRRAVPIDQCPRLARELIDAVNTMREQLNSALQTYKEALSQPSAQTSFWPLQKSVNNGAVFYEKALAFCFRLQLFSEALEGSVQPILSASPAMPEEMQGEDVVRATTSRPLAPLENQIAAALEQSAQPIPSAPSAMPEEMQGGGADVAAMLLPSAAPQTPEEEVGRDQPSSPAAAVTQFWLAAPPPASRGDVAQTSDLPASFDPSEHKFG